MHKIVFAILSVLDRQTGPTSSIEIARQLKTQGITMSGRSVRHHLNVLEKEGYVEGERKKGKRLTAKGSQELKVSFVSNRTGFSANVMDSLAFRCDFNLHTLSGRVILDVVHVPADRAEEASAILSPALDSMYAMSNRVMTVREGDNIEGLPDVPAGTLAFGAISGVTVNSILLKAGIPVCPRYGGVIEVVDQEPVKFGSVISYEGSSVSPLEVLMKGRMTNVLGVLRSGCGAVLGSFLEVPEASLVDASQTRELLNRNGFQGSIVLGRPGKPLMGIPVAPGKAAMVVLGGLNPFAALVESGIPIEAGPLASLADYKELAPLGGRRPCRDEAVPLNAILGRLRAIGGEKSNYWSVFLEMHRGAV